MKYRPWGETAPMVELSSPKSWHFIGCLGTEERSLCAWSHMQSMGLIRSQLFAQIFDIDSVKYRVLNSSAFGKRQKEYLAKGGSLDTIAPFELMAERFQISSLLGDIKKLPDSVVLDITSFPKRFFFYLLKNLAKSAKVRNLLVTYTSPGSYPDDAALYEDIDSWSYLPGFGWEGEDDQTPESWIASIGFLVESLRLKISDNPPRQIKLLTPFPAPLSVLKRSRSSVVELEDGVENSQRIEKYKVDTIDMSSGFDRIVSLTDNPAKSVVFAPFGPKPTTAAMCLYALQREGSASVLYPQPTIYHPEYSKGVRDNSPASAVNTYWIKHDGEFLYEID